MNLYLAWFVHSPSALTPTDTDLRNINNNVEAGNRVIESWLLTIGGQVIDYSGSEGHSVLPADRLEELPEVMKQVNSAAKHPVSFGIGRSLNQACVALNRSVSQGGGKIVLYTPDIPEEYSFQPTDRVQDDPNGGLNTDLEKAEDAVPDKNPEQLSEVKAKIATALMAAKKAMPALEELQQSNPQAYEIINNAIQAMIAMAKTSIPAEEPPPEQSIPVQVQKNEEEVGESLEKRITYPVGTIKDGKKKIRRKDGSTSWVSIRAGQVMDQEGNTTSAGTAGKA